MKRGAPPPNFHHLSLNRWRSRLGRALLCAALLNSAVSPLPTKVQAGYYYDSDGDGAEEYYPDPWETDPGYSDSGYTDAAAGDNTSPGYFDYGDGTSGSGDQPTAPAGAGVGGWPSGGPDSDGDGLEDDFELTVSGSYLIASDLFYDPTTLVWENYEYWEPRVLDPNNVDSDSDGIPDGVEYLTLAPLAEALGGFVSFDPLDPTDGPADYDNDGLSNRLEVMAYGTDPFSWDSDQDGWFDSEEILLQTDPLNPADPGDSETPQSGDSGSGGANGGAAAPLPGSGSGEAAGESPVGGDTPESAATGTGGEAGAASGETAVSGEDPATTSVPRFLLRGGRLFYHTGEFVKSPVYWWYLDQNDNEGFDSGEPSRPSATPLPEGGYEGNPAAEGYRFLPEMSDSLAQTWFQDQNGNGRFDPPMEPSVLVIDPRTRGGGGPSGEQWFRNRAGGSERWHDGGPRETVHFTDGLSAVARYPELATRGEWRRFTEADKEAFQARAWWGVKEAPPVPADFVGSPQEWNPDAPQVFDIDALATEIRWASQSPVMEDMEKTCLIEHGPLTAQAEPNHQQANIQAVTFFIKKGETVARVAAQGGSAGAGFSLTPTSVILNPPLERGRGHFARLLPVEIRADTNRDGTITGADDTGKDEFTNERGAVYVVNYDHDEERDGGKQEDALKWKATSDGKDDYGVTQLKLRPNGEEWNIDPDKEDPADLTPLEISVTELPENVNVFLKVQDDKPDDAKAFHLYIARHNEAGEITQYVPLWGGFDVSGSAPQDVTIGTEVDITKWVNENASDYDDTRESAGSGPYKLYLEGTIFRSMPIPGDDGYGRYDGTSEIFDGDIEIGLELRDGGSAMAAPDWVKLSHCAVEPDDPNKIVAFEGHTDYHTAQGFGKNAKGGRYGHVYTVTSTGDDGDDPATLRYAVESPVPRTIIFALDGGDGTITLTEPLQAKAPRMTIAGQTAFRNGAEGMCLKGNGLIIQGDDMVVRYIRSRPGPAGGGNVDAITIADGSSNVIVDHCSTSFSTDTLIDVTGENTTPDRLATVQNCIMAWPLDRNNHIEKGELQNHGYGSLIRAGYGSRITYWRNLYAHCRGRCPRPGAWFTDDSDGMQLDFINNVIFAWWGQGAGNDDGADGFPTNGKYNFVSNYYRGGADADWGERTFFSISNPNAKGWVSGNRIKLPPNNGPITPGVDDPEGRSQYDDDFITYTENNKDYAATRQTFEASGQFGSGEYAVPILPQAPAGAPQGEQSVKADVGASMKRDRLDLDLLGEDGTTGEYKNRHGNLINNPSEVGGWPMLSTATPPEDADKDGVPDDREPTAPANRDPEWRNDPRNAQLDDNGDGRTNLEEYLTEIVSESSSL